MKLFIPAVGYRIKLTQPWTLTLYGEDRNQTMFEESGLKYADYVNSGWGEPLKHVSITVPIDTVLEVDRVYIRNANKDKLADNDYDSVTFRVIDDKKKKRRFWAKLVDVNNIEYELPVDHDAGKVAAVAKASQRKKLDPQKVREIVSQACRNYTSRHLESRKAVPAWFTTEVKSNFEKLEKEFVRLYEPHERAKHEKLLAERRAKLEQDFASGKLTLPISLADKIKSIDDLEKFGIYKDWIDQDFHFRGHDWDQVVSQRIMGYYGYAGNCVFSGKMADGTRCRTFRPAPPDKDYYSWDKDAPDLSHMWIKVYTDAEDLDVVRVESGIDSAR